VYRVGSGYDNAGILSGACVEASAHLFGGLYSAMGDMCVAY